MKRDLLVILTEMVEMIERARFLVGKLTPDEFEVDIRTNEAIYSVVLKFGEASAILLNDHAEVIARFPRLPLKNARDMRNRLIHGYWTVNLRILYDVATIDMPQSATELAIALEAARMEHQEE